MTLLEEAKYPDSIPQKVKSVIRVQVPTTLRLAMTAALAAALVVAAACSSNNNSNTTANTNTNVSNKANTAATVVSSPAPAATNRTGSVAVSPSALAAAGAQKITLIATDNKYSQPDLTAKANQDITLTLTNQGQAIHNWHVLGVKDKDGKDIATKLLNPGQSDTIDFVITQPGKYKVQCDAHPADMTGSLTITP
jgi:uncharacterized cupredoxin-like copper-binding protein